ncbi:hypothetical protein WJX73_008223 [Symbiochloris irregularis]|uniref:Uncharacterized protein n=1 Tax=Symbiochloris irregularis TaxID=706552 RepID=A0AAW1NQQ2_9CHLO
MQELYTWAKRQQLTGKTGDSPPVDSDAASRSANAFDSEIALLAIPALAALAADPAASLVDTAFLGRIGSVQVAASGAAISITNSAQKLLNVPLLAVTTNTIASADGRQGEDERAVSSASSAALALALIIGILQAAALLILSKPALAAWGIPASSPLRADALTYLQIKAFGAPALVVLFVLQGAFRGLGDTRTPLYATLFCNAVNIAFNYMLLFVFHWGIAGSAWATVGAEALTAVALVVALHRLHPLRIPGREDWSSLKGFAGPVGLLALRTVALTATFALATAMAARSDVAHAASHQICLQMWLASSLLADALAVAAQTLVARLLASGRADSARAVSRRVIRLGLLLGGILAAGMALGTRPLISTFTQDSSVRAASLTIFPLVALTQPLNALAFVWDGVLYGAGGFSYAAKAMPKDAREQDLLDAKSR